MKYSVILLLIAASPVIAPAQSAVDLEKEKAELLRLHKSDREVHFRTDVELLQAHAPEEFIAVSGGKNYRPGSRTSVSDSPNTSRAHGITTGTTSRSRSSGSRKTGVWRG